MAKVNDYEARRPSLYPKDVPGEPETIVGTIMAVDLYRQNTLVCIELYEHPGFIVWARGPELKSLTSQLGRETDTWKHRRVVLEKVVRNNPRTGGKVTKYVVAAPEAWGVHGREGGAPPPVRGRKLRPRGGAEAEKDAR